jgi:ABC-type spermidine/putrescine transport system permease subunit II
MDRAAQRLIVHRLRSALTLSSVKTISLSARAPKARSSAVRRRLLGFERTAIAAPGLVVVALTYVPLVGLALLSFSDRPMSGLPYPLTLRWYERLIADTRWIQPIEMSLLIGLIVAAVSIAMGVVVGRALPLMRERGAILAIFLVTLFVPGTAMGVGMFLYYRSILNLRLGLWSLLLGHLAWAFPFALLSVLVVASRFDQRLLSAAADLGASPWQRFWQIELPLLRPGIVGGGIFAFLLSFNELPRSSYLRGVTTTLPLFEWAQATTQTSNIPFLFALSSVTLAVSLPLISVTTWILFRRTSDHQ